MITALCVTSIKLSSYQMRPKMRPKMRPEISRLEEELPFFPKPVRFPPPQPVSFFPT